MKMRHLLSAMLLLAWNLAAEVYYQQDFSKGGIPSHHLIGIVPTEGQTEFRQAMELRSREEDGNKQAAQGNWKTQLRVPAGKPIEIDYRFCPVSGDARYALLVSDTAGKPLITLVWDGRQLQAADGATGKWRNAAPLAAGEWAHIRYVLDGKNGKWDLYVNDMEQPVLPGLEFRNPETGVPGSLWSLGSQSKNSASRFALIEVRDASTKTADRQLLLREDFSAVKPTALCRVVDSGTPEFPKALEVLTVQTDGKASQGSWGRSFPSPGNSAELVISYYFKPVSSASRYALLVNAANGKRMISLVQENGKLRLTDGGTWRNGGTVKLNEWNLIRYRINLMDRTFDLFVNDMNVPAAQGVQFRDADADVPERLWTLGNQDKNSSTLFGPITVSAALPGEFPPATAAGRPFHLHAARFAETVSGAEAFEGIPDFELYPAAGTVKEAARVALLRDDRNLHVLFKLDAPGMAGRPAGTSERDGKVWKDDCFELFLQPDRNSGLYYHWVGNAAGTLYDARCTAKERDRNWDSRATVTIDRQADRWNALLTIPFSALGGAPSADAVWGFNAGRENPASREILSRVPMSQFHQPELFGTLCFPEPGDRRPVKERTAMLLEKIGNLTGLRRELQIVLEQLGKSGPEQLEKRRVTLEAEMRKAISQLAASGSFPEYARSIVEGRQRLEAGKIFLEEQKRFNALFAPGSPAARRGYAIFAESPMVKVKPGYSGSFPEQVNLRLSGNEYGSFQLVLLTGTDRNLGKVKVTLSALAGPDGKPVAGAEFESCLVEPVMTAKLGKPSEAWPDILRPGKEFHVGDGLAALWFDLRLPGGTPAGNYTAAVTVTPEGMESVTVPVNVAATGLSLPKSASLDTAFCFSDSWVRAFYNEKTPPEKRKQFYRFLLAHRLEPMNLWDGIDIGVEFLDDCAENGKTMLFLPITEKIRENEAKYRELIERYRGKLRPIFFGYDEVLTVGTPEKIKAMQRDFAIAKELFPEVPRLNTASIDARLYGKVDIWCPLFDYLDLPLAQERQAKGEHVWWYPTDYPLAPYANFNLDSPGIDPRVIPWMTWKLNLSGLLYWGLNREWLTNSPVEAKAARQQDYRNRAVEWLTPEIQAKMARGEVRWPGIPWLPYFRSVLDPQYISSTNGGGNLLYPAPDWEPWASTRLKNLRDGMQDYEYFAMLKHNTELLKKSGTDPGLVKRAEAVLKIDDDVIGGATGYTQDPEKLLAFRNRLIDLVLETGKAL